MSRCHVRRASASALFLCTALVGCTPADRSASQVDSGRSATEDYTCLVAPPLLGLRIGDSITSLRAAAGQPLDSVRVTDDVITYRFRRADVRFDRGFVDRIVVTEAGGWPRGLAVGSTRSEVDHYTARSRLLRMTTGDTTSAETIEIAVCPGNRALLHLRPALRGWRVRGVELLAGGG